MERSASVYLPPLLFNLWTEPVRSKEMEGSEIKEERGRRTEKVRENEANKTLHKLKMGDSVLMPSFTEEIAWERESL